MILALLDQTHTSCLMSIHLNSLLSWQIDSVNLFSGRETTAIHKSTHFLVSFDPIYQIPVFQYLVSSFVHGHIKSLATFRVDVHTKENYRQ